LVSTQNAGAAGDRSFDRNDQHRVALKHPPGEHRGDTKAITGQGSSIGRRLGPVLTGAVRCC
jgi:hypothetical protein